MKKILFTINLLVFANFLFAQSLYFGLQGGYNYGIVKQKTQVYLSLANGDYDDIEPYIFVNATEDSNGDIEIDAIPISFAQGFSYGANIGFMYKKFGFEINGYYQTSQKYNANYFNETYIDLQATNINIIPAFVYKSDTGKFAIVSKLGLIIANSEISTFIYNPDKSNTIKTIQTGNWYFGAYLSVGAEYKIFKDLYINAFIDCSFLQYNPEKTVLTEYTYQNTDQIPFIEEDNNTIYFVDSKNIDNINDENKRLKPYYNFSNIGFKIAIKYNFNL